MPLDVRGFVTPLQDFSSLDRAANTVQENKQFKQQMAYRQQKEKEGNELYNLNRIRQATDASKYNDVEAHVDKISAMELGKIQKNALENYVQLEPAQMEELLTNDLGNFIKWHTTAKATAKKLNSDFSLYKDQNKNINPVQAYDLAQNEFLDDFIDVNNNGELTYKDPNMLQGRDYIGILNSPEMLGKLEVDTSPFQKAIEAIPKSSVGDKEYKSNRGFSHRFDWSGLKTDYSEVVEDERGRPTGFQLKTDRVVDGKKLIPLELKQELLSQPMVRNSVQKLWQQKKQEMAAKGVQVDPKVEGELFDMFLYEQANKHLPHDIKISEGQVVPKTYNTTNVNVGGKNNDTQDWVLRFKSAAEAKSPEQMAAVARELFAGNGKYSFVNLKVSTDDLGSTLYYKDNETGEIKTDTFKMDDPTIYFRLAGKYQELTGSDQKLETNIFGNKKDYKNKTEGGGTNKASRYLIKGKNYTESELLGMGYTLDQIKQYKQ